MELYTCMFSHLACLLQIFHTTASVYDPPFNFLFSEITFTYTTLSFVLKKSNTLLHLVSWEGVQLHLFCSQPTIHAHTKHREQI
jgi:hypothetical protein